MEIKIKSRMFEWMFMFGWKYLRDTLCTLHVGNGFRAFPSLSTDAWFSVCFSAIVFGGIDRNMEGHGGPLSKLGLDVDATPMLIDNVMAHHQAEAGPLILLGRKEGVKKLVQIFFRNAGSRILNRHMEKGHFFRILVERSGHQNIPLRGGM